MNQLSRILALVSLIGLLPCSPPTRAESVHVGGSASSQRIVFDLPHNLTPEISRTPDGLNVKFPDTVGKPATISATGLVKEVRFDGKQASITVSGEFSEKHLALANPPRFAIDITAKAAPAIHEFCPIAGISQQSTPGSLLLRFKIAPHYWPAIRLSGPKLYLIFPGSFKCSALKDAQAAQPYLLFEGSLGLAGSTALIFGLNHPEGRLNLIRDRAANTPIVDLTPQGGSGLTNQRFALASQAYDRQDLAAVLNLLSADSLSPRERVLKARALWRISWPYGDPEKQKQSLALMGSAIKSFADEPQLKTEYLRMLIRSKRFKDADEQLDSFRNSTEPTMVVEGMIMSIARQNAQQRYQDAYADYGRLLRDYGAESIPPNLRAEFIAIMGQTYQGLNDQKRALENFRQALSLKPDLAQDDPDIHARMGAAALNQGDYQAALEYYLKAVNLGDPRQQGENLIGLGDCLYNLKQTARANLIYAEVERIAPRSGSTVIAKLREARALLDADGDQLKDATFDQVLKIYNSIDIPPEEAGGPIGELVQIRKAQLYARHSDWDASFEAYYQAWSQTKKDSPVHSYAMSEAQASMLKRIRELYAAGDYAQILALYERYRLSFLKDLKDYEIIYLMAEALEQQGKLAEAARLYGDYAKADRPRTPEALAKLYELNLASGNPSGALNWCNVYLKRYPAGRRARELRTSRGDLLYRLGRNDEAVAALTPLAGGRDEASLKALSLLSDIYRVDGDWQNEARTLERIIALGASLRSPLIEKSIYIRAGQLQKAGDSATAKRLYLKLMQDYPDSNSRWWAQYAVAGLAINEGQTEWALNLMNQIVASAKDPMLLNATRSRLQSLRVVRDVDSFRNQIKS